MLDKTTELPQYKLNTAVMKGQYSNLIRSARHSSVVYALID